MSMLSSVVRMVRISFSLLSEMGRRVISCLWMQMLMLIRLSDS